MQVSTALLEILQGLVALRFIGGDFPAGIGLHDIPLELRGGTYFLGTSTSEPSGKIGEGGALKLSDLPAREPLSRDHDLGSGIDTIIEVDHIGGAHANAAVAGRATDHSLFRSAVNVDKAAVGIAIVRFFPLEPENAGDDRITARGIGTKHLTGETAALEDGTGWEIAANFAGDGHFTEWCAIAAFTITEPKFRCGDGIHPHGAIVFVEKKHPLIFDADDHFTTRR